MSWLRIVPLILPAVTACGKKPTEPTGGSAGSQPWRFAAFVDAPQKQLAVVTAGNRAALVGASGRISSAVETTGTVSAQGDGTTVVISDNVSLHALDESGRVLWHQAVEHVHSAKGTSSLANADDKHCIVLGMSTGKRIYDSACTSHRVYYHPSDGYVFADASELWFVDEATGKERWRQKLDGLTEASVVRESLSLLVVFPDRRFVELDYTTGRSKAEGTCVGSSPGERKPGSALPCAGVPAYDAETEAAHLVARNEDGSDYYLLFKNGAAKTIVARDPVGRTRWSAAWPIAVAVNPRLLGTSGSAIAFVTEPTGDASLVVFDDSSGQPFFQHPLGQGDRVLSIPDGQCWGIVTAKAATCLDVRSGAARWTVPLGGASAGVWLRADGGALIADGNPIALSRVDVTGRRLWQTELPGAELAFPDKGPGYLTQGNHGWRFSDVLGALADKDVATVLDLGTGKQMAVK